MGTKMTAQKETRTTEEKAGFGIGLSFGAVTASPTTKQDM